MNASLNSLSQFPNALHLNASPNDDDMLMKEARPMKAIPVDYPPWSE